MNARTNITAAFLSAAALTALTGSAIAGEPQQSKIPPATEKAAPTADFNLDGTVNVQDVFAFIAGWFAGQDNCDIDSDGHLSGYDVLAFINMWLTPAPAPTAEETK